MKLIVGAMTSLFLVSLTVIGCESAEENLCEAECDCEGCNELDFDRCQREYEEDARDADFRGCSDFYDDWIACREATWFCDADFDFETACGPERERLKACID